VASLELKTALSEIDFYKEYLLDEFDKSEQEN